MMAVEAEALKVQTLGMKMMAEGGEEVREEVRDC